MIRFISILLVITNLAFGSEHVVAEFDAAKRSTAELMDAIKREVDKGATVVHFPSGSWRWHDLSKLGLKPKGDENLARIQIKYPTAEFSKKVKTWISENEVKAVQIGIHGKLPADAFFRLEKILTIQKIPYVLFEGSAEAAGEIQLIESDGSLRIITPKKLP